MWSEPVSDQKRKRVLKREGMLKSMFEDRLFCMCMLGTLGTLRADLIYLMSNGKCTLRALLGKTPPNECLDWWSLSLTVSAPKQLFRLLCVYVDRAASPAHMSKTIVRHCQCRCQVHLLLYNKCIVHTNVLWYVLQVLYIQILE